MPPRSPAPFDLDVHLGAICAGDPDAFGRWVAGAEPALRLGLRSFGATVDTEAVLQETLLRLWQIGPRFQPDGRPNGLLRLGHRIAKNLAISEARRLKAAELDERSLALLAGADDAAGAEPGSPDPLLRRAIGECREALPAKPAQALAERLQSGGAEPDQTLAERLGMKLNTFLQNFTRARKLLAECLRKRGIDLDLFGERRAVAVPARRGSLPHAP